MSANNSTGTHTGSGPKNGGPPSAKVVRRYDTPATPYRRLLDADVLTSGAAKRLTATYIKLNPAQLRRDIGSCQRRLRELGVTKVRPA